MALCAAAVLGVSTAPPASPGPSSPAVDAAAAGGTAPATVAPEGTLVELTVREPAGVRRQADPVTSGVPLPRTAEVRDPDALWLLGPEGRTPVPAQFRVLSRWGGAPDDRARPIRWVLVDFQADVPADGSAVYTLGSGPLPGGGGGARSPGSTSAPSSTPTPLQPLEIVQDGRDVVVDTGPLRFRVDEDGFDLFDEVWVDGDGDGGPEKAVLEAGHGGGVVIVRPDGTHYDSRADSRVSVAVEERGPLRTVLRIDGRHRSETDNGARLNDGRPAFDYLDYTVRIHAYAGKPWVRLFYSVRYPDRFQEGRHNQGGGPVRHEFDGLSLLLPADLGGRDPRFAFGGEAEPRHEVPPETLEAQATSVVPGILGPDDVALLLQDSSGVVDWQDSDDGSWGTTFRGFRIWRGEAQIGGGRHAAGWAALEGGSTGMVVGVRHFWQNFPKGLALGGDGSVRVDLWPPDSRDLHRLAGGRQKTHELYFRFGSLPGGVASAGDGFRAFAEPLRALAPATWYRDSLALGLLSVEGGLDEPRFGHYERTAEAVIGAGGAGRDLWYERYRFDIYGWRNWGDSYRAGSKDHRAFGNNEFDFSWCMLVQYLRKTEHDRRYFELGESMARHLYDIDIYHTDEDATAYSHGIRQHDSSGVTDHSKAPNLSHAWIRGLLTYWLLTGDAYALDGAREVGLWIDRLVDDETGELAFHAQTRSQAWAALALTDLWEATGEARYLEEAGRLLRAEVIREQSLEGAGYPHPHLDWRGDAGELDKEDAAIWQNGYVAEALGRYAMARRTAGRADREAEAALFRLLDAIADHGFATPENGLFDPGDPERDNIVYGTAYRALVLDRIDRDGSYTIRYPNNQALTDGYAYGALLSPDPDRRQRYLEMAGETWIWTMGPESAPEHPRGEPEYCCPDTPAKNAGWDLRFGQAFLWLTQMVARDGAAPEIRDVEVDDVGAAAATVRWRVDGDATGWVEYGGSPDRLDRRAVPDSLGVQAARLVGLPPGSAIHFRIVARDLAGHRVESPVRSFRTASREGGSR